MPLCHYNSSCRQYGPHLVPIVPAELLSEPSIDRIQDENHAMYSEPTVAGAGTFSSQWAAKMVARHLFNLITVAKFELQNERNRSLPVFKI